MTDNEYGKPVVIQCSWLVSGVAAQRHSFEQAHKLETLFTDEGI